MSDPTGPRQFATTQWSLVGAARLDAASESRARAALEQLCRSYWYPLYAFARSRGHAPEEAQDLTQAFFARILETDLFAAADRERGRFRSFLLGAMKHFLANEWHRSRTKRRGGDVRLIEWDALDPETRFAAAGTPAGDAERMFDREWALETTSEALRRLRLEMDRSGQSERYEALAGSLIGEVAPPRQELAARLGMSEGAVKVAVHRLRRRYRELLRAVVAETVRDEANLDEEMRYLVSVLRSS